MKTRSNLALMLAASALLLGCGGEKPGDTPDDPAAENGAAPEAEGPPPAPEFIDSSNFFEVADLRKKSPEEALAIYAAAEARLGKEALLAAARPMVQPATAGHLDKWEAQEYFIEAKHFGQTRFIIVFSGPGTGDRATDKEFLRDLGNALSSHSNKVVYEEIANASNKPTPVEPATPDPAVPAPATAP